MPSASTARQLFTVFAVLIQLLGVAAQDSTSTPSTTEELTVEVSPSDCANIVLYSGVPERASYRILPLTLATSCGLPLQISLPQDTRHLAWALYNAETTCAEVREPTIQPASYSQAIHLDFVDVGSPSAWELIYHSCTDTTWEFTAVIVFRRLTVGPIAPSVFVYNPCDTAQEFSFNLTIQKGGETTEEYCDRLETQNDGEHLLNWMLASGLLGVIVITCCSCCICTGFCTCCCCCARPGWCNKISTPCSRGCYKHWGNLVTGCGCGWMMRRGGGIRFYTENQNTSLLFWSFAASCMHATVSIQFPQFERDDVNNPMFTGTRSVWGAGADTIFQLFFPNQDITAIHYIVAVQHALDMGILPFVAMVLNFSDPVRDPSFCSKGVLCGMLMLLGTAWMCLGVADSWLYYDLWEYKGHQIVLQLGLFFTQSMTILSYIQHMRRSSTERAAVMRTHGGKLPDLLPSVDAHYNVPTETHGSVPVAVVVCTDTNMSSVQQTSSKNNKSSHGHGIHALAANTASNPAFESSTPATSETSVQDVDNVHLHDIKPQAHSLAAAPKGSILHLRDPEVSAVTAAEAGQSKRSVKGYFNQLWESVREDPTIGFKYSVFISASLLLTFITLTAALLRMLHWVRQLADCTEEGSTCLHDVQLWFYRRVVQGLEGLVMVDAKTLELQRSGECGPAALETQVNDTRNMSGNGSTTGSTFPQVSGSCEAVEFLNSAQEESSNPEWISNAKYPVLIGGHIGFPVAYCLGLYTIFHVARAYKKLELKLRAAKAADLLFQRRSMNLSELKSAAISSTAMSSTAQVARASVKHKIGKNILDDFQTVKIAQSAYFVGALVSTCQVQLALAGTLLMVLIGALLHPNFWEFVGVHFWWPVSVVIIILWHVLSQALLNKYVADGERIKRPFLWLFAYVALSAAYCMVGLLIAFFRLVWLMVTSIVALSRLDACLFTVMKGRDAGYASFLAMALMLHALKDCLAEHHVMNQSKQKEKPPQQTSNTLTAEAVQTWKHNSASSSAYNSGPQADAPTEIRMTEPLRGAARIGNPDDGSMNDIHLYC